MHPIFTLFMSAVVPPLLSLAPSLHAGYALTPLHWSSCVFGWIVAACFWHGGRRKERAAEQRGREQGRRDWLARARDWMRQWDGHGD